MSFVGNVFVAWFLEAKGKLSDQTEIWTWWEGWQNIGRNRWKLEYFKGNGSEAWSEGSDEA